MQHFSFEETGSLLNREMIARRGTLVVWFAAIALLVLALGLSYKAKFEASTTIFVDGSNIIRPLLDGTAAPTEVADRAAIASEVIFSRDILNAVLLKQGFSSESSSPQDMERLRQLLFRETSVVELPGNLIQVAYVDTNPQRAYGVTQQLADAFVEKSVLDQARESYEAFLFIERQVSEYREKLSASEKRLSDFRTAAEVAVPGNTTNIEQRMIELNRDIEITEMQLIEARARSRALSAELNSQSTQIVGNYRNTELQQQIVNLQAEVDRLRLDYTDTYPDIIRLRQQIADLRARSARERQQAQVGGNRQLQEQLAVNPAYQAMQHTLIKAKGEVESLQVRLSQKRALLKKEGARATQSGDVVRELADLQRDYQVNHDIYQDLLRRRESARVSMKLDEERQGLSFRIQEPARVPSLPKGLRFLHFLAGGLLLGALLPLAVLYVYLRLSPKLRVVSQLQNELGLPVMAVVPHIRGPRRGDGFFSQSMAADTAGIDGHCSLRILWLVAIDGRSHLMRMPKGQNATAAQPDYPVRARPQQANARQGGAHTSANSRQLARVDQRAIIAREFGGQSRSIVQMQDPRLFTARQLDYLKIIHPQSRDTRLTDTFRELRTRLMGLREHSNFTVMVTSVVPQGGSTFVSLNLAASIAFDEHKTSLLVDCNLQHPYLHRILNLAKLDNGYGLTNFLHDPNIGIESIVRPSGIPRMRLVPVGRNAGAKAEYFSSHTMRYFVSEVSRRYRDRYILFDAPSIASSADAKILAQLVDFIILVVPYGQVTASHIADVCADLDQRKLVGTVLNDEPPAEIAS